MKIASEKKAAAARANGALSRGPVTPEGKARSSQNATTHGLAAHSIVVLRNESPEAFGEFLSSYNARFQPVDDVEKDLVYQIVACSWRLRRAVAMETRAIDNQFDSLPSGLPEMERTLKAFCNFGDTTRAMSLDRYQSRLERTQSRLIRDFLQLRRQLPPVSDAAETAPEPEPPTPETPSPEPPSTSPQLQNEPITASVSNESIPLASHPEPRPTFEIQIGDCDPLDLESPRPLPWSRGR